MSTDRATTVLLGRPGELRERLEAALREAGADIALVLDPADGNAAQVQALSPRNVVVLVEPGVDETLDAHYDALFEDSGIELLFEEASVLASRQGWDLARWGRHLSAKLRGSQDVLPKGHGDDAGFVAPLPRDALKPRPESPADAPAVASPQPEPRAEVPTGAMPEPEASPTEPFAAVDVPPEEAATEHAAIVELLDVIDTAPIPAETSLDIPVIELEDALDIATPAPQAPGLEGHSWISTPEDHDAQAPAIDFANDGLDYLEPVKRVPRGGGEHDVGAFDPTVFMDAAHHLPDADAIPLEPLEPMDDAGHPRDDLIALEPVPSNTGESQPLALASAASMDAPDMKDAPLHESWSLVDHDVEPAPTPQLPQTASPAARLDGMSMVDDGTIGLEAADNGAPSTMAIAGTRGAVLVVAGVGGPDPLRALLGQLQEDFPRPILIQQHLDAGNYDRLARQMERATRLRVKLATAGMAVEDNIVYVLPISLGLEEGSGGLAFVDLPQVRGFADVTSRLDPADSALLVLSGAPTDFIEEALRFKVAGAWVAAQAEHGCFDHAVPALVAARGAEIAEPLALAQKLNARWHA